MLEDDLLKEIEVLRQGRNDLDISKEAGIETKTANDGRQSHLISMYLLNKKREEIVEAGDQGDKAKYGSDIARMDELIVLEEKGYYEGNPIARDFSTYVFMIGGPGEFVLLRAKNQLNELNKEDRNWVQKFQNFETELKKVKYPTLGEGDIRHLEGIYFAAKASIANGELRDYIGEDMKKLQVIDSALSYLKSYIDVSKESLRLHERDNGPFKRSP